MEKAKLERALLDLRCAIAAVVGALREVDAAGQVAAADAAEVAQFLGEASDASTVRELDGAGVFARVWKATRNTRGL